MNKARRVYASWQYEKLANFVRYELDEIHIQRVFIDLTGIHLGWNVGEVMHFLESGRYREYPGALVTLYRASRNGNGKSVVFTERYEAFHEALKREGFL